MVRRVRDRADRRPQRVLVPSHMRLHRDQRALVVAPDGFQMNMAEVATMVQGREREILQLVDEGMTNKAIARHLVVDWQP